MSVILTCTHQCPVLTKHQVNSKYRGKRLAKTEVNIPMLYSIYLSIFGLRDTIQQNSVKKGNLFQDIFLDINLGSNSWGMITDRLMDNLVFYAHGPTESFKYTRDFVTNPLNILNFFVYTCVVVCKDQVTNSLHNRLISQFEALLGE